MICLCSFSACDHRCCLFEHQRCFDALAGAVLLALQVLLFTLNSYLDSYSNSLVLSICRIFFYRLSTDMLTHCLFAVLIHFYQSFSDSRVCKFTNIFIPKLIPLFEPQELFIITPQGISSLCSHTQITRLDS